MLGDLLEAVPDGFAAAPPSIGSARDARTNHRSIGFAAGADVAHGPAAEGRPHCIADAVFEHERKIVRKVHLCCSFNLLEDLSRTSGERV